MPAAASSLLLRQPVLRSRRPPPAAASTGTRSASQAEGVDRHALELDGDHVAPAGQLGQRARDRRRAPRSPRPRRAAGGSAPGSTTTHRTPSGAAASASMRPSWPPPSTPTVVTGGDRGGPAPRPSGARARPAAAPAARGVPPTTMAAASSPAFVAPARADGHGADRHAARHLHDRQQRVHAVERLRLDRHAEHRHARCGRPACPGRWAAPPAPAMMTSRPSASAPSANSARSWGVRWADTTRTTCGHLELVEHLDGVPHRLPVRPGTHHDGDERCHRRRVSQVSSGSANGSALALAAEAAPGSSAPSGDERRVAVDLQLRRPARARPRPRCAPSPGCAPGRAAARGAAGCSG